MESKVLTFDFIPLPYATSYFFHMPNFLTQFLTSSSFGLVWKALNPTQSVKKQVSSDHGGLKRISKEMRTWTKTEFANKAQTHLDESLKRLVAGV